MQILAIGTPFLDRTLHVTDEALIEANIVKGTTNPIPEKEKVEEIWQKSHGPVECKWSLGGSVTNVIKALSPLLNCFEEKKFSCSLLGIVGKDKKKEIEEKLKELNVQSLLVESEKPNGFVNCFVTDDSQRTMLTYLGASTEFSVDILHPKHFEETSHVHLEGYLAYASGVLKLSEALARENGATVSLDLACVQLIKDAVAMSGELKECANKADIVFGNFQEMQTFTDSANVEEMFQKFQQRQIVVITNGEKGGWVKQKDTNEFFEFQANQVENAKDTTGAGDFFMGGFLASFLNQKDLKTCAEVAALVASCVIQQDGTDLLPSDREELNKKVKSIFNEPALVV